MDGVCCIKQMGCHSPEGLELICKPGVTDNNGIGRTIEMPVDNINGLVRKDMNIKHRTKGHSDNGMQVVLRQAKNGCHFRKLSHK